MKKELIKNVNEKTYLISKKELSKLLDIPNDEIISYIGEQLGNYEKIRLTTEKYMSGKAIIP